MSAHIHHQNILEGHERNERATKIVVAITAIMMVGEIVAGLLFGSMALLADGWHMSTHVAAFGITLFAYWYARRNANNPSFKFGTGKVGVLGGFASAVALVVVAAVMAIESIARAFSPEQILFDEALVVATIGLIVNLGCARILHSSGSGHSHDHHHHHEGHGHHHHHDHNLKAAYLHVLADALTSVFAIVALIVGKYFGWLWLDAMMGIVGAAVITKWAWGLLKETSTILLDAGDHEEQETELRRLLESDGGTSVRSMQVWKTATHRYSVAIQVASASNDLANMKSLLNAIPWITHSSIEISKNESPSQED